MLHICDAATRQVSHQQSAMLQKMSSRNNHEGSAWHAKHLGTQTQASTGEAELAGRRKSRAADARGQRPALSVKPRHTGKQSGQALCSGTGVG